MNKRGQGAIIGMAIATILSVVILGTVWSFLSNNVLDQQTQINESHAANQGALVTMTNIPVVSILGYWNSTSPITSVADTSTYLCNVSQGTLKCNASSSANIYVNYTYLPTAYLQEGTTKTIVRLVPIALALVLFVGIGAYLVIK